MKIKDAEKLKVGMWIKTKTDHVSRIVFIDLRFPLMDECKFPIIYTDDGAECWSCDSIEQYGFDLKIS